MRDPLSFRLVGDILPERGVNICRKTAWSRVERLGQILHEKSVIMGARKYSNWQLQLVEVLDNFDCANFYPWRPADHAVEALGDLVSIRIVKELLYIKII